MTHTHTQVTNADAATALVVAAEWGDLEVVRMLLVACANKHAPKGG